MGKHSSFDDFVRDLGVRKKFLVLLLLITGGMVGLFSIKLEFLLILLLALIILLGAINPEIALYVIFAVIFFGFDFMPQLVVQGLIIGAGTALLTISLILRAGAQGQMERIKTPLDFLMFLWIFLVLISAGFGVVYENEMRYVLGDLLQFLELALFFFLTLFIFRTREQINRLWMALVTFAFISATLSLLTYLRQDPITKAIAAGGVRERLMTNVVAFTPFLLAMIIARLVFLKSTFSGLKLWLLGVLFLVVLLFSFTRSYWLGLVVALVFIFSNLKRPLKGKLLRTVFLFFLIIVLAIFFVQFLFGGSITSLLSLMSERLEAFRDPRDYVYYRFYEMMAALPQCLRSPLWGTGLGGEYLAPSQVRGEWEVKHYIHNNYVQIMLRTGFLGLVIFLAILGKFFGHGLRIYNSIYEPGLRGLILGFLAALASAAVISISSPLYTHYAVAPFLGMLMGLVFVIEKFKTG